MKLVLRPFLFVFIITIGAPFAACNSTLFMSTPSGSDNSPSASALFSLLGNQLTIRLTNSSPGPSVNSDVLTGLYFSSQPLTLSPVSAVTAELQDRNVDTSCAVGCETGVGWQYQSFNSVQNAAGISAVGPDGLQQGNFGPGVANFGIVPIGNPLDTVNQATYAVKMMTFTLTVPDTFSMSYIDHVVFVWNTYDPVTPFQDEAPEPGTWVLMGGALAALGAKRCSGDVRRLIRKRAR